MAPRKNIEKKPTVVKKSRVVKSAKQGFKKSKPQNKSPGATKLKISDSSSQPTKTMRKKTAVTNKVVSPKITRKQLTIQRKIELANEVANVQLIKKEDSSDLPVPEAPLPEPQYVITITRAEPVRKRAIKKKKCPEQSDSMENMRTSGTGSEEAFDLTPKKRKCVRKAQTEINEEDKTKSGPRKYKVATNKLKQVVTPAKNLKQTKIGDAKIGITNTQNKTKQSVKRQIAQRDIINTRTTRKKKLVTEIEFPSTIWPGLQ